MSVTKSAGDCDAAMNAITGFASGPFLTPARLMSSAGLDNLRLCTYTVHSEHATKTLALDGVGRSSLGVCPCGIAARDWRRLVVRS